MVMVVAIKGTTGWLLTRIAVVLFGGTDLMVGATVTTFERRCVFLVRESSLVAIIALNLRVRITLAVVIDNETGSWLLLLLVVTWRIRLLKLNLLLQFRVLHRFYLFLKLTSLTICCPA